MDRLKFGMIGVGGIAQGHIDRLLKLTEVEIVAICDPSEASLDRTRQKHKDNFTPVVYTDYIDLLEKSKPDAVVICTPHSQHFQQAMDSIDAGAHVLLEKPMVNRVAEAKVLLKRLETSDRVVGLAYQRHTQPEFRYIRQAIASGEYGAVQFITALQQQAWKRLTKGSWRQDPELSGGGQINDSGSHLLDIILWTTGLAPDKVAAFMDKKGTPVDINSAVTVKFVGGAMGTLNVVGDAEGWYEDITIWCERGTFYMRNASGFQVQGTDGKISTPDVSLLPSATNVNENFVRAIQGLGGNRRAPHLRAAHNRTHRSCLGIWRCWGNTHRCKAVGVT